MAKRVWAERVEPTAPTERRYMRRGGKDRWHVASLRLKRGRTVTCCGLYLTDKQCQQYQAGGLGVEPDRLCAACRDSIAPATS